MKEPFKLLVSMPKSAKPNDCPTMTPKLPERTGVGGRLFGGNVIIQSGDRDKLVLDALQIGWGASRFLVDRHFDHRRLGTIGGSYRPRHERRFRTIRFVH